MTVLSSRYPVRYLDQGIIRNFAPWFRFVDIEPVLDVFDAFGQTLGIRLPKMEVRLMEPFDVLMYQFWNSSCSRCSESSIACLSETDY